jgi:hypothetical protein
MSGQSSQDATQPYSPLTQGMSQVRVICSNGLYSYIITKDGHADSVGLCLCLRVGTRVCDRGEDRI